MRILVTGKEGQFGLELIRARQTFGVVIPLGWAQMNLEFPESICAAIREIRPGLIMNMAAYIVVDQAEHILATGRPLPSTRGLYHQTAAGYISWLGFAGAIFKGLSETAGRSVKAGFRQVPVSTAAYLAETRRPANSQICCKRLQQPFAVSLPDGETGVQPYLREAGL